MADVVVGPNQTFGIKISDKEISSLVPGSLKQLLGILEDKFKQRREENLINFLKKHGIPENVTMKFLYPFIEAVSNEDDETLQQKWANLLDNASSEKKGFQRV